MHELVIPMENRHMKDKVNFKVGIFDKKEDFFFFVNYVYLCLSGLSLALHKQEFVTEKDRHSTELSSHTNSEQIPTSCRSESSKN